MPTIGNIQWVGYFHVFGAFYGNFTLCFKNVNYLWIQKDFIELKYMDILGMCRVLLYYK